MTDIWEEVDFFNVRVGDEIKHTNITNVRNLTVEGTVVQTRFNFAEGTGHFTVERGGDRSILRREYGGKPPTVTLYRKRKKFQFPTRLGAVIYGEWNYSRNKNLFTHIGQGLWVDQKTRTTWVEDYLTKTLTNIQVKSEGVSL